MRMQLLYGNTTTTDVDNALVLGPHFAKVFCANLPVEWFALYEVRKIDAMQEIYQPISWDEIKTTVTKLINDKAPGLNKVPPNAFKALNDDKLTQLLECFNKYWIEENDFDQWHKVQIAPVPKIGYLSNPKKWRGVTLMDIGEKIFSIILCGRAFKIIKAHEVKYQFASTPGVGCQDGSFTLKTLIHLRHRHNLPIWFAFTYLVKDFDTSNHKLLISIIARYGAPPSAFVLQSGECTKKVW